MVIIQHKVISTVLINLTLETIAASHYNLLNYMPVAMLQTMYYVVCSNDVGENGLFTQFMFMTCVILLLETMYGKIKLQIKSNPYFIYKRFAKNL